MLDEHMVKEGDDGKLKAFFIQRKDGQGNDDLSVPEEKKDSSNLGPCADKECVDVVIENERVNSKKINVKTDDGKSTDGFKFRLFNETKQLEETEVVVVDGKISLNLIKNNKYYLQLINENYSSKNIYISLDKEGEFVYGDKLATTIKEILLNKKSTSEPTSKKYLVNLNTLYNNGKIDTKFKIISEIDTFEAESQNGVLPLNLLEGVTYVVKPVDQKYKIDIFPLVLKDKSEYNLGKYAYDHSSCNIVKDIILKDNDMKAEEGSLVCANSNTTIFGMDFKDLSLYVNHLDKQNFDKLKNLDVDILGLNLINPHRCELTKIADGEFKIKRRVKDINNVKKVYYIDQDGNITDLSFTKNGDSIDISGINSIGFKKLVIEYENRKPSNIIFDNVLQSQNTDNKDKNVVDSPKKDTDKKENDYTEVKSELQENSVSRKDKKKEIKKETKSKLPKTNIASTTVIFTPLAIVSAIGIEILRKKK